MSLLRVRFRPASFMGTPLQADTIFGHFCWAIRYREGESALSDFLAAYDEGAPPLLLSDGFPVVGGSYYIPRPTLPSRSTDFESVRQSVGVREDDPTALRRFAAAWKAIDKKAYVEINTLLGKSEPLKSACVMHDCFALRICPRSMAIRDESVCKCSSWNDCPALNPESREFKCTVAFPEQASVVTTHNVINRWNTTSINLYTREDSYSFHDFYFLARIDGDKMTENRFHACMEFIRHSGYGRDKSVGCGAIKDLTVENWSPLSVEGANAFVNLSSAYVPKYGQLSRGFYNVHVKRGKLGGDYVLQHSPWKRPILMIRAGSVFEGDPSAVYGGLVRNVHYELDNVVQYGYAFPLGVKVDAEAF